VQVQTIFCDETEVGAAKGGENLRLRLSGIDEDDVQAGFVVCDPHVVVPVVTYFEAQLQVTILCDTCVCQAVMAKREELLG
jgi:peptide chain release factor subunit 3